MLSLLFSLMMFAFTPASTPSLPGTTIAGTTVKPPPPPPPPPCRCQDMPGKIW